MLVGVLERVFWVVSAISHKILSFIFLVAISSKVVMSNNATDFVISIFFCELAGETVSHPAWQRQLLRRCGRVGCLLDAADVEHIVRSSVGLRDFQLYICRVDPFENLIRTPIAVSQLGCIG